MLFNSLEELWDWMGTHGPANLRIPMTTIGPGLYKQFLYNRSTNYVPGTGFENLQLYGPYGSIPVQVSKMIPENQIYLGTEDQYLRELADQQCREILLGDIA